MSNTTATAEAGVANGNAAAAFLAAGIGVASLGILALLADASPAVNQSLALYRPSGALSGVTTTAIGIWLASWAGLTVSWRGKNVGMARISLATFSLLAIGILLTFPPFMDLLQGK